MTDTMIVAHYYAPKEVQEIADYVGDSLELARIVAREKPERLVFASVRFMAEQAKLLSPNTEVILPAKEAGCSLVDGVTYKKLQHWTTNYSVFSDRPTLKVVYVNSSIEAKAWSDIVVTSSNARDIVGVALQEGFRVLFAPDRNMGYWLQKEFSEFPDPRLNRIEGDDSHLIKVWQYNSCIVHDQFAAEELDRVYRRWTDGSKYLIAHPESLYPILERADFVGSTKQMLQWVEDFEHSVGTIFVATEEELVSIMKDRRPDLHIESAPTYDGCKCSTCPFMKMNSYNQVELAILGIDGEEIFASGNEEYNRKATESINRMLEFNGELR